MRAIVCRGFDEPLRLEETETPRAGAGEVLVETAASGVNFVDGLITGGRYQIKPPLPYVPGFEIAGTVRATGPGIADLDPGTAVLATTGLGGGGYAEYAVLARDQVFTVPPAMTPGQAAVFVQSYCTAWFALRQRVRLQAGQTLLVLGASGGVGRAAVDVGKALGARVIAAASSESRLAACGAIGADGLIDYTTQDLKSRARELSGGGVDVVFDPVGGEHCESALRALAADGTLLVIGFAAGSIPRLPANQILLRNRRVVGVDWGGWRTAHPGAQAEMVNELLAQVAQGRLHPPEPTTYPLADAARALEDVANRRVVGKVALVP